MRGAVVGAVQSGKTAHMLAVTARALDAGYRIVVVLAGLKDDLRTQTARRFNVQLLRQRDPLSGGRSGFTLSESDSEKRVTALAPPYYLDSHQWALFHIRMMQAVERGTPVVATIKKNQASLSSMRERLRQAWARLGAETLPLLILDDECDEASVEPDQETPTPALIANLWQPTEGMQPGVVAYVGYTATVAANLLQEPSNDLYPTDFVYLIRSPAERDSPLTFREPQPHAWYCGGEVFYERFVRPVDGGSSLLVEPCVTEQELAHDPLHNESLKQAIRTFLLGAALRQLEHPEFTFDDPSRHPKPHSMIVQASTTIVDHEKWARAIRLFLGMRAVESGVDIGVLHADRVDNDSCWSESLLSLQRSREVVSELQPHPWPLRQFEWADVWAKIVSLSEHVRLRVLNSAPGSVDVLDFESAADARGEPILPRDLLSIIVGGGRLSRGLTIEGLSVSYFSRWADVPAEDTVQQLSRWYGYRGMHLDYCRVYTTAAIAGQLAWIHAHDQEMRSRLASLMQRRMTPRDAGLVLSSIPHGLPTAKLGVGKLLDISYSPWCRVLTFVEIGECEQHNQSVALELLNTIVARGAESVTTSTGSARGVLSRGWPPEEIIAVLEALKYTRHNPNEELASLGEAYRRHDPDRPITSCLPEELDPYAIAAYLRKWKLRVDEEGGTFPPFNVGVAYGNVRDDVEPFSIPLAGREISTNGFVNGGWIGRSDGWAGDQFFDGVPPALLIDDTSRRKEGADGMLLLYITHKDSLGRRDRGQRRDYHSPMLGISIPAGGPTLRRVVLEPSRGIHDT